MRPVPADDHTERRPFASDLPLSPPPAPQRRWPAVRVLAVTGVVVAVLAGGADFWATRFLLNPDGISYIDMARQAITHRPAQLINGYWSPGYPLLLMVPLAAIHAGWATVIPALHAVNLLLYFAATALFVRLLMTLAPHDARTPALTRLATAFGAMGFAYLGIRTIGLGLLTPDFAVALAVFATAISCVRWRQAPGRGTTIAFGVVLGAGYWIKGIMFPVNVILVLLLLAWPPAGLDRRRVIAAAGVALVVALPLVIAVSVRLHRVTTGDVGRLNYAWYVGGAPAFTGWPGDSSAQAGTPLHPPRAVASRPLAQEFATPDRSTYALWYDPSYWNAGLRPRFDVGAQGRAIVTGLHDVAAAVRRVWIAFAGLLLMWTCTAKATGTSTTRRLLLLLFVWSVAAMALYAAVHVESRFLPGFLGVIAATLWAMLLRRRPRRGCRIVAAVVALGLAVGIVADEAGSLGASGVRPDYLAAGEALHRIGVPRGAAVAAIGDAFEQYAAFVAGTAITVQVLDSAGYWNLTPAARDTLNRKIAAAGAAAVLANNVAPAMAGEDWHMLPGRDSTNVAILLLCGSRPQQAAPRCSSILRGIASRPPAP